MYEINDAGEVIMGKHTRVTLESGGEQEVLYLKGWTYQGGVWLQDMDAIPLGVDEITVRFKRR